MWSCTLGSFKCSAVAPPSREPFLCWGLAHFRWVLLLHVDREDELDPEPEVLHLQRRISGCDQKPGGSGTSDPVSPDRGLISLARLVPPCSVFQNFLSAKGGLMYWIGLSQRNGTWAWVDNTVLQQRWMAKSCDSSESIPDFPGCSTREPALCSFKVGLFLPSCHKRVLSTLARKEANIFF